MKIKKCEFVYSIRAGDVTWVGLLVLWEAAA